MRSFSTLEKNHIEKLRNFIIPLFKQGLAPDSLCEKCRGTGLDAYNNSFMSFSWSGEYCDYCKGVGFKIKTILSNDIFICDSCHGTGLFYDETNTFMGLCEKCSGEGFFNWIENIMGKK